MLIIIFSYDDADPPQKKGEVVSGHIVGFPSQEENTAPRVREEIESKVQVAENI